MANLNYLLITKLLAEINKNKLNNFRNPRDQERDELFYWIMSRLMWSIIGGESNSHDVKIQEFPYGDDSVLLKHGRVSDHVSKHVKREEFYSIMQEVTNMINEIGENEDGGYAFYAHYVQEANGKYLLVHMQTTT